MTVAAKSKKYKQTLRKHIHSLKSLHRLAYHKIRNGEALRAFTVWRYRHLSSRQFVFLASVVIGILAGLSSVILKNLTHYFQAFVENTLVGKLGFDGFYFAFPVIGIVLTLLSIKYIVRAPIGHGIPSVLYAISRNKSVVKFKSTFSSLVTAPLTVGFGGSAGLEGPSVASGAAIGSNFARMLHLDTKTRTLLLGCGTAAALSAIFKVPITGIIFVIEVFALDFTTVSLIPLMISSATGLLVSYFFMGHSLTLDYSSMATYNLRNTFYYIGLGIFTAIASIHFTKLNSIISHFFENKLKSTIKRLAVGSVALGCLIYLMPVLYGEGYGTINKLLAGEYSSVVNFHWTSDWTENPWIVSAILLGILYLKMIASSVTFAAGGVGGTFAPTLFMGAVAGLTFAKTVNLIRPAADLPLSNFTLVGMTGLMAGVMHAPLTAVFLIVETTGGYALIAPVMLVSSVSFIISKLYLKHNIYTEQLRKKGDLRTHDRDKTILSEIDMEKIIERDFIPIPIEANLGQVICNAVSKSSRNIFPVVSKHNHLRGIVLLDDIRPIMFSTELYDQSVVGMFMQEPPAVIVQGEDTVESVMRKFQDTGSWNLPVVGYHRRYVGFISKSKLLSVYRSKMLELNTESLF